MAPQIAPQKMTRVSVWIAFLVLLPSAPLVADGLPFSFSKVGSEYRLTLQPNPNLYFELQRSPDLLAPYSTIKMALGVPGPVFGYTPASGELQAFLRARGISVFEPEDQDNDYIDDIWELQRSYLDPLAPNDAFLASPEPDAGGRNNVDYYFFKRGTVRLREVHSREVSTFNFGAAFALEDVVSRETSVFNFGSPAANVGLTAKDFQPAPFQKFIRGKFPHSTSAALPLRWKPSPARLVYLMEKASPPAKSPKSTPAKSLPSISANRLLQPKQSPVKSAS